MKIAVNTRLLQKDKLDGIGVFTNETLQRIVRAHPEHEFIFLFDRPYDPSFIFSKNVRPVVLGPRARHPLLFVYWLEVAVAGFLKKESPDLFISPDGFLSLSATTPSLAVIHDLNFEHGKFGMPWHIRTYYRFFFPRFARKATRVATVSEFSRKDISQNYSIPGSKIDVVYNGAGKGFRPATQDEKEKTKQKWSGGEEFFLFTGSIHERKNISRMLMAFDLFRKKTGSGTKLILAGHKLWWTKGMDEALNKMQHKGDVIFTGRISQEELERLMPAAKALVYVPLFEGFGIPVLEAMNCNVPVIASASSSLPEVCGNAALMVDPLKTEVIAQAMELIERDEMLRRDLLKKAEARRSQFSWDRSAELLWQSAGQALRKQAGS